MQRLYVGGLSHTVTQKDLKDRFGKFGDVQDVELRTRRDEEGVPYKTFSYINISISEANLKKCMTVLNKSKWKGGTLQIETAKESFLHRLAEERQAAAKQRVQQPAPEDKRQKMLDSLSSAGVDNFTMKAAVPGSEVPGHKDWVVSKFGRVLPVLQLRCHKGTRNRTMKYDPSKYCHNIRKLDRSTEDQTTPVNQLTWELQAGDDDISKKRRGEFPPYEPPRPKKRQTDTNNGQDAERKNRFKQTVNSFHHTEAVTNGHQWSVNHRPAQRRWAVTDSDVDSDEEIRRMVAAQEASHAVLRQEVDEDNLEVVGLDYLTKSDRSCQQQKGSADDEEENGYNSADTDELLASCKPPPPSQEKLTLSTAAGITGNDTDRKRKTKKKRKAEEEEDDSADEEHLTSKRPSSTQQKGNAVKQSKTMKVCPVVKQPMSESDGDDEDEETLKSDYSSDSDYEAMFSNVTHLEISLADLQRIAEESQQTPASSSLSSSLNKQASLTSKPTPKKGITPEEILAALMEEDSSEDEQKKKKRKRKAVKLAPLPVFQGTKELHEGSESEGYQEEEKEVEERREGKVKNQKVDTEAPRLTQERDSRTSRTECLESSEEEEEEEDEEDEEEEEQEEKEVEDEDKDRATCGVLKEFSAKTAQIAEKETTGSSSGTDDNDEEEQEEAEEEEEEKEEQDEEEESKNVSQKVPTTALHSSSSSLTEEDNDEQKPKDALKIKLAPPPAYSESSSSAEGEEEEEEDEEQVEKEEVMQVYARPPLKPEEEEERQRKANLRRLAAVQQRQKEAEEQKKQIQGALAKLDAPTARTGKHIVFGSDDDEEEDEGDAEKTPQTTAEVTKPKKTLFEESQSEDETSSDKASANKKSIAKEKVRHSGPQLFNGSEDEEDGDEDDSRFNIRPQFEGRAGQKLMELQSRFGTDERFRIDSRFLEDEEEEEEKGEESEKNRNITEEGEALEDEKMRTLSILQSVLGSSQQTCSSKTTGKAVKTFKDVSTLHYDPSREEHAAFETKTTEIKESKAARRKKREEAQKLPEVSKEIYYDVSGDLKAVFGQTKVEDTAKEEETGWDQVEEEEEKKEDKEEQPAQHLSLFSADASAKTEESSGFKFSFFGDDTDTGTAETEYKVESIQAPKVSWQQDPRFHDSSSEEDEEEQEEEEEQSNIISKTKDEATPSKADIFFFFSAEDSRLSEGPKLFCRPSHLEEQREQWEERRNALRQECRKKHKDARRKLRSSQKS